MQKKLTIMIDEEVYAGLYRFIGRRKISQFIERLVRPHVLRVGTLSREDMGRVERAIRVQLGLR
ncbi:MAG: hypothetical protein ABR543_09490 [Gemmatimonadaceae bacterium]